MSGSFEKSLAPPKAKYVEHIFTATHAGDAGVAEIFRALQNRLRDSTWTIVFKALIIVHLMIREGEPNVTLKYLAESPSKLAISNFSDVQVQGTNIRHYYSYILARAKSFRDTRIDWVRDGVGRLKRQSVDKGLLRETEAVQSQISSLLKCDLLSAEAENEITVCAFRLLTMDLLVLYAVMNEGTINVLGMKLINRPTQDAIDLILEHYFEMSKYDAQRALAIYKTFTKQTNFVVEFLSTARQYENATRLEIPKLKHAPTSLTASLEEYLNDPDFEVNRRQYLAHTDARKGGKLNGSAGPSSAIKKQPNAESKNAPVPEPKSAPATAPPPAANKGPPPDLIDFFGSIEDNQQPMATQSQPQALVYPNQNAFGTQPNFFAQNGQLPQSQPQIGGGFDTSNPFGQPAQPSQPLQPFVQQNFTGAGFGGYGPQQYQQPQQQDVFSNSSQATGSSFPSQQPFSTGQTSSAPSQQPFDTGQSQPQSTNPFRQSMFPQATGASMPAFNSPPPMPSSEPPQATNPFARSATMPMSSQDASSPFNSPPPQQQQQQQPISALHMTPQRTGTNPFARSVPQSPQSQPPPQPLVANQTGSTNPFRQSMFVNQQTGQGWQAGQGTMGGLENLPTMPIFPRQGQPSQPQQQQNPWS